MSCSVAQCLDVVGEWWSLLIVRDAMLGVTHFGGFQVRLGISSRTVSAVPGPGAAPDTFDRTSLVRARGDVHGD